ncbi:MAG: response regulator [Candidatus Poribacteria bacterium]|nr:response regulator [Candidatus Poribacteria bacterium]
MEQQSRERSISIMVVDDDPSITEMIADYLTPMDYNVRTYNNSHDCLAAFDEQPADIVIADFRMPELDGLVLLRHMKEASPATEVIMITGYGDMEIELDALSK